VNLEGLREQYARIKEGKERLNRLQELSEMEERFRGRIGGE
jgi:hypothetical protein